MKRREVKEKEINPFVFKYIKSSLNPQRRKKTQMNLNEIEEEENKENLVGKLSSYFACM